jgi:nitroimidazol reductase NimA-like FMN-containing flavoprotein (pyridoxamine 5'-phosphate oxidase superfamily)
MTIRTWLIDIHPSECEELLARAQLGRVGVVVDGRPEIFPVNHVFDDATHSVAFPTNEGTKLRAALRWPSVAFEVDGMELDPPGGWSVLVVGRAEEITDTDEVSRLARKRTAVWRAAGDERWLRIKPDKVTGRRIYGPAPE